MAEPRRSLRRRAPFHLVPVLILALVPATAGRAHFEDCPFEPGWVPDDLTRILEAHRAWMIELGYVRPGRNHPEPAVEPEAASLCRADLRDADLSGAYLVEADLREADLAGADLSHANLIAADLSHASLVGANLQGANLFKASLQHAVLTGANLRNAHLSDADFAGARLDDADFTDALDAPR